MKNPPHPGDFVRTEIIEPAGHIAVEAKVLRVCELHPDVFFDGGSLDFSDAYRLGNDRFSRGELTDIFESRREMTDTIKFVVEDNYGPESCWACDKLLKD